VDSDYDSEQEERQLQDLLRQLSTKEAEAADPSAFVTTNIDDQSDGELIEEEAEAVEEETFKCDPCGKVFKSDAQLQQHTASKIHRKKLQDLEKMVKRGKPAVSRESTTGKAAGVPTPAKVKAPVEDVVDVDELDRDSYPSSEDDAPRRGKKGGKPAKGRKGVAEKGPPIAGDSDAPFKCRQCLCELESRNQCKCPSATKFAYFEVHSYYSCCCGFRMLLTCACWTYAVSVSSFKLYRALHGSPGGLTRLRCCSR
jgi:uncharacterized C2H2 Zn-finger protein